MSGELSKFKKYLEVCEKAVSLPATITITGYDIGKDVYLLEDLFLPLLSVYANFLSKDILGYDVFNLKYKKDSNSLLYFKISDGEDVDDDSGSEVVKILFLMESIYQIFPLNALELSKKKFYDEMVSKWRMELGRYQDGQEIDVIKIMDGLIKESLYINLMQAAKQNLKKGV